MHWYDYLYTMEELKPRAEKVKKIARDIEAKTLRVYYNNHVGGKAVLNALQFKELIGKLNDKEKDALARAEAYLTGRTGLEQWLS